MTAPNIKPIEQIIPMVYCYTTPGVAYHDGWSKIGYTEKQTVEERVRQQTHTAGIRANIEWQDNAMYKDGSGEYFKDTQFHNYLTKAKNVEREVGLDAGGRPLEWFKIEPMPAYGYFSEFAMRKTVIGAEEKHDYDLRAEQAEAVSVTKSYFEAGGDEFLWNAKPRFGKTLSSYDLVRTMGCKKVLVVTNRPSIANSWADDFYKFVGWRGELCFVSANDAVKDRPGVFSRDAYLKHIRDLPREEKPGMVAFESLQSLKGSVYFGGEYDKLKWMSEIEFDLLIVDESQEGVDTEKTDRAFRNIKRKHTLYLSGTPFKALANNRFSQEQIFNWSYVDEQRAKAEYAGDGFNSYEVLPELQMYTYQMSAVIEGEVRKGAAISDDGKSIEYAFDLNEFFATKDSVNDEGAFKYKDSVEKFLDALTTQEKYPFSTPELRAELPHTLWLLNRVASAKALKKLLDAHPVFSEYEVVLAAGDGRSEEDEQAQRSYDKVKKAIAENDKTITLSVGQLTVGVTVPEWTGVLMLSNMKSPSSYMQAAFRVQNPYECDAVDDSGNKVHMRKERAYVFDFDPARTLIIFDEFANNLSPSTSGGGGTAADRKENIAELLNFFPVLGEDEHGSMVEIDAQQVLSIPRQLKSAEVVRRGFMSNYLFANIGNVFSAPSAVTEIITKFTPAKDKSFDAREETLRNMGDINVDEHGEVSIPEQVVVGLSADIFGPKIYEKLEEEIAPALELLGESEADVDDLAKRVKEVGEALKKTVEHDLVEPAFNEYELKRSKKAALLRDSNGRIDVAVTRIQGDFDQQVRIANAERDAKVSEASSTAEIEAAQLSHAEALAAAKAALFASVDELMKDTIEKQPEQITKKLETFKAEEEKATVEDTVRAHLRGFARTIPSFIMAYGDENLTLANFDDYTEDDVFLEVTGITEEQFRFLRDGGDYIDEATGREEHFPGGLFDETVFNDSIREFLDKRAELADYFDESHAEDIFDYIPPQKTNQIFTPRWVVKKMVDALEEENPGCYDDPNATFADLYMKSGLYITEVAKRLFRSEGLKAAYPDPDERIRHILQHQLYGMAPTRIIYLIATNYIFGFDEALRSETTNFVEADASAAAKGGKLPELVEKHFGGRRQEVSPAMPCSPCEDAFDIEDLDLVDEGTLVKHVEHGYGEVLKIEDGLIVVHFGGDEKGRNREFDFPGAFCQGLLEF